MSGGAGPERRPSYPEPPLADGVVLLRRWELTDLRCVELASADPEIPEATTVPVRFTDGEGEAWIRRQWARAEDGEGLSLAICESSAGQAVGAVVLLFRAQPATAGIGYWLVLPARGRGLAKRAVRLLARWALTTAELARVEALVEPPNAASRRTLEDSGFRREGLLRSYVLLGGRRLPSRRADVLMYSLLPTDLREPDRPVRDEP